MNRFIALMSFFIFLGSCAEFEKKLQSDWSQKMQGLAGSYNKLLPFLYDDHSYAHPNNENKVKMYLQNIAEDSKAISAHIGDKLSGSDPFFKIGIKQLRQTTKGALESFEAKEFTYSQQLAQSSINYCFKCHTRARGGAEFTEWSDFQLPATLSPIQKSRALIATRQFSKAATILEKFINTSPQVNENELIDGLKFYLIVSLRHNSSPEQAQKMLQRFKKSRYSGKASKKVNSLVEIWESSLAAWIVSQKKGKNLDIDQLLKKTTTFGQVPDSAFVNSLRESIVLHQALLDVSKHQKRAKIFYKLGNIYAQYPELGFWDLPDLYFETCINLVPHSDTSRKCYYSLEKKVNTDSRYKRNLILLRREKDHLLRLKSMTIKRTSPGLPDGNY